MSYEEQLREGIEGWYRSTIRTYRGMNADPDYRDDSASVNHTVSQCFRDVMDRYVRFQLLELYSGEDKESRDELLTDVMEELREREEIESIIGSSIQEMETNIDWLCEELGEPEAGKVNDVLSVEVRRFARQRISDLDELAVRFAERFRKERIQE